MNKNIDYYLNLPYTLELSFHPEHAWFIRVKELPGCTSQGDTPDEAVFMIKDAMQLWIEDALEEGSAVPEPRTDEEYSGKFNLRVPKSLHRKLVDLAEVEGVSLNTYCTTALAESVGSEQGKSKKDLSSHAIPEWEKAVTSLLETFELGNMESASIEERFSSYLTEELSEFRQMYEAGDVKGATAGLVITEKLLYKFGKVSPLLRAISQILFNMRQVVESEMRETPQIYQDRILNNFVSAINKINISREKLEGARHVEQEYIFKKNIESMAVNQFAQIVQIHKPTTKG